MGFSEQFVGIDMKNLIGSPLSAATQASIYLAHSTAEFIDEVGFEADGAARRVQFRYQSAVPDTDGHVQLQEMQVELPLLSVVPIPNLQIDEVRLHFDMEIKHYEKNEAGRNAEAGVSGGAGFGPAKVTVTGNVSSHGANTRSSDNSAKYEMHISASNHGIPEGLARVLDIMAAQVSPAILGSRPVDADGNELDEADRALYQQLRDLRARGAGLERAARIAAELFESRMKALEELGQSIHRAARFEVRRAAREDDAVLQDIEDSLQSLRGNLPEAVRVAADPLLGGGEVPSLYDYLTVRWFAPYTGEREAAAAKQLDRLFAGAVQAYRQVTELQAGLEENRLQCGALLLGRHTSYDKQED